MNRRARVRVTSTTIKMTARTPAIRRVRPVRVKWNGKTFRAFHEYPDGKIRESWDVGPDILNEMAAHRLIVTIKRKEVEKGRRK